MRCKNTIYLGFVGSGKIDNSIKEKLCNLKDINVAIIEIKKYIWFGRNLVYYMDWTTIEMIKEIYEKIKKIERKTKFITIIILYEEIISRVLFLLYLFFRLF